MNRLIAIASMAFIFAARSALAATGPDTLKILEGQKDLVRIHKLVEANTKIGKYQIEICPTNVCDRFESHDPTSLEELADYTYLYAVYVAEYRDFTTLDEVQPFISDGINKGYAEQVLARYRSTSGCSAAKDKAPCIASLRKKLSINRFQVRFDEGIRTVTPEED